MLNEEEKKYWKKVYMYYGNDYRAWINDKLFDLEYYTLFYKLKIRSAGELVREEYIANNKFTEKFIEEILNDE